MWPALPTACRKLPGVSRSSPATARTATYNEVAARAGVVNSRSMPFPAAEMRDTLKLQQTTRLDLAVPARVAGHTRQKRTLHPPEGNKYQPARPVSSDTTAKVHEIDLRHHTVDVRARISEASPPKSKFKKYQRLAVLGLAPASLGSVALRESCPLSSPFSCRVAPSRARDLSMS